jgi:hypothetical protein
MQNVGRSFRGLLRRYVGETRAKQGSKKRDGERWRGVSEDRKRGRATRHKTHPLRRHARQFLATKSKCQSRLRLES